MIPGGSRDETEPAKTGLLDLYGAAWRTSGTRRWTATAMDDFLEARAAHIETGGDVDSTAVSWDSLKGDSDQVFALAMDLLFHPKFSEEKLQLARSRWPRGLCAAMTTRGRLRNVSRRSWCMERTALIRDSRSWLRFPRHAGGLGGLARPYAEGKVDCWRQRRL